MGARCRVGEAASKLDPDFRQDHGEVPWRSIINTRNLLIHAYDQVNPAILGDIVERDIPDLARAVERMLHQPYVVGTRNLETITRRLR